MAKDFCATVVDPDTGADLAIGEADNHRHNPNAVTDAAKSLWDEVCFMIMFQVPFVSVRRPAFSAAVLRLHGHLPRGSRLPGHTCC